MSVEKLGVQRAIDLIEEYRTDSYRFNRLDRRDRSKAHFFEVGRGGKQFALIVGDADKISGQFNRLQTRILLEELPGEIPGIENVPAREYYNGASVNRTLSRLAPPHQCSVLVSSETGLLRLLDWYTN